LHWHATICHDVIHIVINPIRARGGLKFGMPSGICCSEEKFDEAKHKGKKYADKAGDEAEDFGDTARGKAEEVGDKTKKYANKAEDEAEDFGDKARGKAEEAGDKTKKYANQAEDEAEDFGDDVKGKTKEYASKAEDEADRSDPYAELIKPFANRCFLYCGCSLYFVCLMCSPYCTHDWCFAFAAPYISRVPSSVPLIQSQRSK